VTRRWLALHAALATGALALAWAMRLVHWPAVSPAAFPVLAYQQLATGVDGRDCPSWPPCSTYARRALERHGLLIGGWLALDRLIHEPDDLRHPVLARRQGRVRSLDTLPRNDFWL